MLNIKYVHKFLRSTHKNRKKPKKIIDNLHSTTIIDINIGIKITIDDNFCDNLSFTLQTQLLKNTTIIDIGHCLIHQFY